MKKTITLTFLLVSILTLKAQVNNPDFENWQSPLPSNSFNASGNVNGLSVFICAPNFTYEEPQSWSTTNQLTKAPSWGNIQLVNESSTAYSGNKSIKIESMFVSIIANLFSCSGPPYSFDNIAPGLIVNGSFRLDPQNLIDEMLEESGLNALNPFTYNGVGEAIDFIPKSISGYYKYESGGVHPDTNEPDSCIIVSGLKKDGVLIGHVITRLGDAPNWTPFSLDYSHLNCEIPDTIVTVISSSSIDLAIVNNEFVVNSDYTGMHGSVLYIDGLELDTFSLSMFPPILTPDAHNMVIAQVATIDVLANDIFCDGNGAAYTPEVIVMPSNGTATVNAANKIEYTPMVTFTGTDVFTYRVCNVISICDTTTVTVNVTPVPLCYANDDIRTLNLNTNSTDYFDPRVNDVDCGSDIHIVSPGPSLGTAVVESNNFITYTPNSNTTASDMFEYYTCSPDNPNQCDTATVNISIIAKDEVIDTANAINTIPEHLIAFYPNPANSILNISVDLDENVMVTIYSSLGTKMISETFSGKHIISLNGFANGLYFAEITSGSKKSVRKFQVIK